jgi:hypothetical protein
VFENTELIPQTEIDGTAAEVVFGQFRIDLYFPLGNVAPDINVGKDHVTSDVSAK